MSHYNYFYSNNIVKSSTKRKVDRTNEIRWVNERQKLKEGQSRIDPDPSKRQHKPQRQYDPEVNRRVQLNK